MPNSTFHGPFFKVGASVNSHDGGGLAAHAELALSVAPLPLPAYQAFLLTAAIVQQR